MKYTVSTKRENGKWWNWGSVAKNQYGNLQCSFKVTPDLIALFSSKEGSWINFAMFEDNKDAKKEVKVDAHNQAKANAYQPEPFDDSEVPF